MLQALGCSYRISIMLKWEQSRHYNVTYVSSLTPRYQFLDTDYAAKYDQQLLALAKYRHSYEEQAIHSYARSRVRFANR